MTWPFGMLSIAIAFVLLSRVSPIVENRVVLTDGTRLFLERSKRECEKYLGIFEGEKEEVIMISPEGMKYRVREWECREITAP